MNNSQIEYIQERANERIAEILDILGIEFVESPEYLQFRCPIHGSDNDRSLYWAFRTNHFKCMTRHCELEPITGKSTSLFGLVRGIMSARDKKQWNFNETVIFTSKLLGINSEGAEEQTKQDIEINKIIKQYKKKIKNKNINNYLLLRDIINKLNPDEIYYPKRGVPQTIIDKYHISYCDSRTKPFYHYVFMPILDESGKFVVGFSGRSIFEKCKECKCHHDPKFSCPAKEKRKYFTKWKHSKNFKKELYLYNYWFAKYNISKTGTAIIVESPGNVWKFEENEIKNSVALMGCSISKEQRLLLQKAGALTLFLCLDNDETGKRATKKLMEELNYYFRIIPINLEDVNDVAEMGKDDIQEKIGRVLLNNSYKINEI
jgi:DNA primase